MSRNKSERDKQLRSIVNASGFALQLAVEHQVRSTHDAHGWLVETREHPWRDQRGEGFIDLVLEHPPTRLVVECKRPQDSSWVFLVPTKGKVEQPPQARITIRWTDSGPGFKPLSGWVDVGFAPSSAEAEFCVVHGEGNTDRPMLERIASQLLRSVEALADEQLELDDRKYTNSDLEINRQRFFVPAIITTAELVVCHCDPASIALHDGKLESGRFETVPFVRFRKSLTAEFTGTAAPTNLQEAHQDRVRTVLVINATHLLEALRGWAPEKTQQFYEWPWDVLREQERRAARRLEAERNG